jgi:predicted HicB family RNase H-like nuclease
MARPKKTDGQIGVRVSKVLREALERLAAKDRRSLSEYIRLVLEDHVNAR